MIGRMKEKEGEKGWWDGKMKVILGLLLVILGLAAVLGAYVNFAQKKLGEAEMVRVEAEKLEEEVERCKQFVAGEKGEFGEYEYCRRFLGKFGEGR